MRRLRPLSPDPLTIVTQPPPNESPSERSARTQAENEARKISAAIDAQLTAEKQIKKKSNKPEIKVILLGQAESGKSTLRKQFQLQWAARTLDAERAAWRPIVALNIIRGLRNLFEQLEVAFGGVASPPSPSSGYRSEDGHPRSRSFGSLSRSSSPGSAGYDRMTTPPPFSLHDLDPAVAAAREELLYFRTRLIPLIAMEDALIDSITGMIHAVGGVYIRSDWQASHPRSPTFRSSSAPPTMSGSGSPRHERTHTDPETVLKCLAACKEDIRDLWHHPYLPVLLKARRIKLEDSAAFFFSAVERISQPDYSPTDSDILHVRLKTLGVSEHAFDVTASGRPVRWLIYDVGGARGLRQAWVPYFDDATAIIFLAPISAFDQYLDEDPRTNRIDDSLQIFSQICSNKLLQRAHLILLLNKTDLLQQKLEAGIRVKRFITSFADRQNTYEEAAQYFRAHFLQVHRKHDTYKRQLFTHFASVIDTTATKKIIFNVADSILKDHISATGLV